MTGILIGVLIVAVAAIGIAYYERNRDEEPDQKAVLYVGITDAATDINGISDIELQVKKVEVYDPEGGWETVSGNSKTYNLLTLRNNQDVKLYAKEELEAKRYSAVRVTVADPVVKDTAGKNTDASLPSDQIIIDSVVDLSDTEDNYIVVDFLADKSLHTTTDGKYVFAPSIAFSSYSGGEVTVDDNESVKSTGASLQSTLMVGQDLNGQSRTDFELNTDAGLTVDDSVVGKLKFSLGGKTYTPEDPDDTTYTKGGIPETDGSSASSSGGLLDATINTNLR